MSEIPPALQRASNRAKNTENDTWVSVRLQELRLVVAVARAALALKNAPDIPAELIVAISDLESAP